MALGSRGPVPGMPPIAGNARRGQVAARAQSGARGSGRAATRQRERLANELEELERHRATDVDLRFTGAIRIDRAAGIAKMPDVQMRARLVQADMLLRRGDTAQGARIAIEVNRWADAHGPQSLLARSHLVLSSTYEVLADPAACLDHALRAVELLDSGTAARSRGNFVMRLADALTISHSFEAARQRYAEAGRIFVAIGDVERQLNLFNNLAYAEVQAGQVQAAWHAAEEMRLLADREGVALNPEFLDTLARAQMGLGKYILAENALLAALDMLGEHGDIQAVTPAQLLLSLAEVQRCQGRLGAAQDTLDRCLAICVERQLIAIRVEALREQAELHAAHGRYQLAYRLHKTFHEEVINLTATQREASARTRQAMFETVEARQEARRFWEQARTDPLTGLHNRRFVDEELPTALVEHARSGSPLCVAILDADHFKRINDTLSHEVGDRVIRTIAALLREGVVDAPEAAGRAGLGIVARLGGEEFLIVLAGIDLGPATILLETLRRSVAEHAWGSLTGSLPVTVSVGLTIAAPGDSQASVLRRADRGLYSAKAAGRDRVVAVPGPEDANWLDTPADRVVDVRDDADTADGAARTPIGRDGTDASITLWPRRDAPAGAPGK